MLDPKHDGKMAKWKSREGAKEGAPRKPESPEAVTARGRSYRERQARLKRHRFEVTVTDEEEGAIKALLRQMRT